MIDELSRALVGVILHDLANTTQYLVALNALLADAPTNSDVLGGLSETSVEVEDLGFVLGLVAFAAGADILHDRARRDGLDVVLAFGKRALRREKLDLVDVVLPHVRIDSQDRGRGVTWAAARFAFAAARTLAPGARLQFDIVFCGAAARLVCATRAADAMARCAHEINAQFAGLAFESDANSCTLVFPDTAFESRTKVVST